MNEPEEKTARRMTAPVWGGLLGGIAGGVVAGVIIGVIVASSVELRMSIPFPDGADRDYLCICRAGTGGDSPGDYIGSMPPGKSCPHTNPCNNVGCDTQRCTAQ